MLPPCNPILSVVRSCFRQDLVETLAIRRLRGTTLLGVDIGRSSPMNSMPNSTAPDPNDDLVARADERLAHAYEQIARADEQVARVTERLSKLEDGTARKPSAVA